MEFWGAVCVPVVTHGVLGSRVCPRGHGPCCGTALLRFPWPSQARLGEQGVREVRSCSSTLNVMTEAVLLLQLHPQEMPSDHCCGMSVSGETDRILPAR